MARRVTGDSRATQVPQVSQDCRAHQGSLVKLDHQVNRAMLDHLELRGTLGHLAHLVFRELQEIKACLDQKAAQAWWEIPGQLVTWDPQVLQGNQDLLANLEMLAHLDLRGPEDLEGKKVIEEKWEGLV